MNLLLNDAVLVQTFLHNAELFKKRFPKLSHLMRFEGDGALELLKKVPDSYRLEKVCGRGGAPKAESIDEVLSGALLNSAAGQTGNLTLSEPPAKSEPFGYGTQPLYTLSVNGRFLHSKYNPAKEAEKTYAVDFFSLKDSPVFTKKACTFYGLGLGYLPELFAAKNARLKLIIIEPDLFIFALFLASRLLDGFFSHEPLTLLLGACPLEVLDFLETGGSDSIPVFRQQAVIEANSAWFLEFDALKKRREEKNALNKNTLKKFGKLWLKNLLKNINFIYNLQGITCLQNLFTDYSAVLIAAGPGLNDALPVIAENASRFIVIAADTSVRACLKHGITPDFVLLMDAQYWNYLHLAGVDLSESVLITESSVHPAVFRIKTYATLLCSSGFPLAQYIEKAVGEKGRLVTGGSVATAAWDFARFLGVTEIITAGLDLSFPHFQTHAVCSRFEEDAVARSTRLSPAETASHRAVYSAHPQRKEGYKGTVLTDKRMQMYAWWFESKIAEFSNLKTLNLMPCGLKIPNMPPLSKAEFIKKAHKSNCSAFIKKEKIKRALHNTDSCTCAQRQFKKDTLTDLKKDLEQTVKLAKEGSKLCAFLLTSHKNMSKKTVSRKNSRLSAIDKAIFENKTNAIIGFNLVLHENPQCRTGETALQAYEASALVYGKIIESAYSILKLL